MGNWVLVTDDVQGGHRIQLCQSSSFDPSHVHCLIHLKLYIIIKQSNSNSVSVTIKITVLTLFLILNIKRYKLYIGGDQCHSISHTDIHNHSAMHVQHCFTIRIHIVWKQTRCFEYTSFRL